MKNIATILLLAFSIRAFTVHDLTGKKYILIQTTDTFPFNKTKFLYHIFDLDLLFTPYRDVLNSDYQRTVEVEIMIKKIKTLYEQIRNRSRNRRSLNFLGTALSWLTGIPDHDDLIEIKQDLNELIVNNNQQKIINERFNKFLMHPKMLSEGTIIFSETLNKLKIILETINFAKNKQFFSQSVDLGDLEELIRNEENEEIPLLDILEYADIHVCQMELKIIIIYKYPIIMKQCKHFKIIPLAFRHGKIQMDSEIMKCGEKFIRTKNCKNNFRYNICQMENDDKCTSNMMNQLQPLCNVLQENNEKIQFPEDGYIILDGTFEVNNKTIDGINLIEFENNVTINKKLYVNHKEELKQIIKSKRNEDFEMGEILESNKQNKFTNIQSMKKFIIPFETHPVKTIFYIIMFIFATVFITLLLLKMCKRYNEFKKEQNRKRQNDLYLEALKNRGIQHSFDI